MRGPIMDQRRTNPESGFLLPIVAILMATISIFLINGFAVLRLETTPDRIADTIKRQDKLQNFLSAYAHRNYRIPCPANPDGETTATIGDDGFERPYNAATGCDGGVVGIIPWKTLGIPQEFAKDAWGRYFTYAVSPVFTMVNRNIFTSGADPLPKGAYGALDSVHARCRLENVWVFNTGTNRNLHPFKARFCCAPSLGLADIQILGYTAGTSIDQTLMQTATPVTRSTVASLFANFDTPVSTYTTTESPTGLIYMIVSHGNNGNGAYLGPQSVSNAQYTSGAVSAAETENNDGDTVFQWSPTVLSNESYTTAYYDDILAFGTQDTLWARLGGYDQSCARPYTDYAPMEWQLGPSLP
jgi:hypothetical protein